MSFKNPYKQHNAIPNVSFPPVQIDDLSYMSLGERIDNMINHGKLDSSNTDEFEYDQEEGDWSDPEPDFDETNRIDFDEIDALDKVNSIRRSVAESEQNAKELLSNALKESKETSETQVKDKSEA